MPSQLFPVRGIVKVNGRQRIGVRIQRPFIKHLTQKRLKKCIVVELTQRRIQRDDVISNAALSATDFAVPGMRIAKRRVRFHQVDVMLTLGMVSTMALRIAFCDDGR